jgi:hypothetical protein
MNAVERERRACGGARLSLESLRVSGRDPEYEAEPV